MDKDRIELPWLDRKNGDFEVNLYNFDVPRYNPYDAQKIKKNLIF